MKITLDTSQQILTCETSGEVQSIGLYTPEAFSILSQLWLKVGWDQKYSYTFTWLGRPIVQLPEDILRMQEVLYHLRPDVIVETGIAHGGSLIFYASLCQLLNRGRVIGVDIEIRPYNRQAIESHPLFPLITLLEGSSTDAAVVQQVTALVKPGETVLVILDSAHNKAHVRAELEAYASLVTPGSYIVATDGIMQDLYDVPHGHADWITDNAVTAVTEFIQFHPEFVLEQPTWLFNESALTQNITHWPEAWLRRTSA